MTFYAKSNDDRLPSVVLQVDSNSSAPSDYNSYDNNLNGTLSVQSSINDNSSNDLHLFPPSITDNNYHTQGIVTDATINYKNTLMIIYNKKCT